MFSVEILKKRLKEIDSSPQKAMGQNFLVSSHVISSIIEAAREEFVSELIEIGPGLGALTDELIKIKSDLRAIEFDKKLVTYWEDRGLSVISGDALKINWNELSLPAETLLVSNLPYQISSSIVIDRSIYSPEISGMVLMFQKEVAQRILAGKSTKENGLLTIVAQTFWDISKVVDAGPKEFYPPPKIASRVLKFKRKPIVIDDGKKYLSFVKTAFVQRRKKLTKNLSALGFDKVKLKEHLEGIGFKEDVRAEHLDSDDFVKLFNSLGEVQ
ncbi:MAG: 16S rRNA (adenine(1518)-N(6)/adenine(1519)-N(6))-dimethyltransferase RsmA [Bdellovibrionales bacterium]